MEPRPFVRPALGAVLDDIGHIAARAVAEQMAAEIDHDILHEEHNMKLDGWIFHSESAHRDGVQLTFAPATQKAAKGSFNLTCKREEVKDIVGDLRPGDHIEITISPGKAPAPASPGK